MAWLERLQKALLDYRERCGASDHNLDPSDIFLSIQGVALRFRSDNQRLTTVALSTAALLAEVNVGPAFGRQLEERRSSTRMVATTTMTTTAPQQPLESENPPHSSSLELDEDEDDDIPRHVSVPATPSNMALIPEVLPTAMVRFAASASTGENTTVVVVRAQIRLVLALCAHNGSTEWSIPGVNGALQTLVLAWIAHCGKTQEKEHDESSTSVVVMAACAVLGRAGWRMPHSLREPMLHFLLEHWVRSEPAATRSVSDYVAHGYPLMIHSQGRASATSSLEDDEWEPAQKADDNAADDLFVVLLERETWAVPVVDTLLENVNKVNQESPQCVLSVNFSSNGGGDDVGSVLTHAAVAVRVAAMALWGPLTSPSTRLRVYWHPLLLSLHQILSALGSTQQCSSYQDVLCRASLVALHFVLTMEIRSEISPLVDSEWEILVACLEGVLPLLRNDGADVDTRADIQSLFELVGVFCRKCAQVDTTVPFADFPIQEQLYLLTLKEALPFLSKDVSRSVGVAVVQCWAKYGVIPFRFNEWSQTGRRILQEAFRLSEHAYVHHPSIRLESLRFIVQEPKSTTSQSECNGQHEYEHPTQNITPLRSLSQYQRENYLELVETCIIPVLQGVLCNKYSSHDEQTCPDCQSQRQPEDTNSEELCKGVCTSALCPLSVLELYAVRSVGRLCREALSPDVTGHRAVFVSMLQSVARNCTSQSDDLVLPNRRDSVELSHTFCVRMAAVQELDLCLDALLSDPRSNCDLIPPLLDALRLLLDDYTNLIPAKLTSRYDTRAETALAIAGLSPLSRLRVDASGDLLYQRSTFDADDCAGSIGHFLKQQQDGLAGLSGQASFVFASPMGSSGSRMHFSFQTLVNSTGKFLAVSAGDSSVGFDNAIVCMRVSCFRLIRSLAIGGVELELPTEMFATREPVDNIDNSAMTLALAAYMQNCLVFAASSDKVSSAMEAARTTFRTFFTSFGSISETDRIKRLQFVPSFLPTLQQLDGRLLPPGEILNGVRACLEKEQVTAEKPKKFTAFLCVVLTILGIESRASIPESSIFSWFRHAYSGLLRPQGLRFDYLHLLAFRCVVALIDGASESEALKMKAYVEKQCKTSQKISFQHICLGLLRNRILPNDGGEEISTRKQHGSTLINTHRQLVVETKQIESFEVEALNRSKNQSNATWLLEDNNILTFRVGASGSRYTGWLEVILRTAFSRKRFLVRIAGRPSLDSPELPILVAPTVPTQPEWEAFSYGDSVRGSSNSKASNSPDAIEGALSSLRRFDLAVSRNEGAGASQPVMHKKAMDRVLRDSDRKCSKQPGVLDEHSVASPFSWVKSLVEKTGGDPDVTVEEIKRRLAWVAGNWEEEDPSIAPRRMATGKAVDRAIAILDRVPCMNHTHKVALVYDRRSTERVSNVAKATRLLDVSNCSPLFHRFMQRMGELLPTRQLNYFSAGLDVSSHNADGEYALVWMDHKRNTLAAMDLVVFHVSSLMPADCLSRKKHLGNDNVLVVFCEGRSGLLSHFEQHDSRSHSLIGGMFGFVTIFVRASNGGKFQVSVRVREEHEPTLGDLVCDCILPEKTAPLFVRDCAMRADLACRSVFEGSVEPPSNILRRMDLLNKTRRHVEKV